MAKKTRFSPMFLSFAGLFLWIASPLVATQVSGQEFVPRILQRILQGTETDDYPAVGIVGSARRGGFCTGTLISQTHVLTAAHCAEVVEQNLDGVPQGTFQLGDQVYETASIHIHPDYNAFSLANDIAIFTLSEPVLDTEPAAIFRGTPLVGDALFIVGFGGSGTAQEGSDGSFGTKRVGVTTVDEVTDTLVTWVFDDPSESNAAGGDSGGPGFLEVGGDLFIACIVSAGTEPDSILGDFAINTRIDAFADWIDATVSRVDDPISDDPTNDGPTDDGNAEDHLCDLSGPFPVLQCLINLLTELLSYLNDQNGSAAGDSVDGGDIIEPETPSDVPVLEPAPSTETPIPPAGTLAGTSDDPTTPAENPVDCPVDTPEPPATGAPTTEPPATDSPAETPVGGTIDGIPDVISPVAVDPAIVEAPVFPVPVVTLPITFQNQLAGQEKLGSTIVPPSQRKRWGLSSINRYFPIVFRHRLRTNTDEQVSETHSDDDR